MRAFTLSFLVASALILAGCLGGGEELEDGATPVVESTMELGAGIESAALGQWVESGTTIDVAVTPPADAVGNVTYTWAIMQDPFTLFTESDQIDTGNITPGGSADIVFDEPGFYEYGHCDPHPWMKHTVAVLDGYEGPEAVTVYIMEGELEDQDSWVFEPQHLTIGTGTTVTYENIGRVAHTASIAHEGETIPVPTLLDLKEASGTVTVEGTDWMNLLVLMEDEAGNTGYAKDDVYVRPKFPDYQETNEGTINLSWPGELGEAPDPALNETQTFTHRFSWSGTVGLALNVTGPTEPANQVNVIVRETESDARPDPQVLFESGPTGSGSFEVDIATMIPLEYEVVLVPIQGALIDFKLDVTMAYDYTPPTLERLPCAPEHYYQGHCG